MLACVVCEQPVCRSSARICSECGRATCAEHEALCHAADGQPMALADLLETPEPEPEPEPPPPPSKPKPKPPAKSKAKGPRQAAKQSQTTAKPAALAVQAVRLNVELFEDEPRIVDFAMRSTRRVLAVRTIELRLDGIYVNCEFEKSPCPADGWLHRPGGPLAIPEQIKRFLLDLRKEYHLAPKRTTYYTIRRHQVVRESRVLRLPPIWRDERLLDEARQGFDNRRRR